MKDMKHMKKYFGVATEGMGGMEAMKTMEEMR